MQDLPAEADELASRAPAGRAVVGDQSPVDESIPVTLTTSGIRFSGDDDTTFAKFIRHYIGFFVVRRFLIDPLCDTLTRERFQVPAIRRNVLLLIVTGLGLNG